MYRKYKIIFSEYPHPQSSALQGDGTIRCTRATIEDGSMCFYDDMKEMLPVLLFAVAPGRWVEVSEIEV